MATFRSNNGKPIDMGALMRAAESSTPAVGNMRVNANGDVLGKNGEIIKKNEERVRDYYKNNPRSSTSQASLKGPKPSSLTPDEAPVPKDMEPDTAKTGKENKRTAKKKAKPVPEPVAEPDEFDAPMEPIGYKEVELPNGDIDMVPVYKEEDL